MTDHHTPIAPQHPGQERQPARVTVVVCTRNRSASLSRTLAALQGQSAPPGSFEVLVVDDGSSDATGDVARRFGSRLVTHETGRGIAAARNSGVQAARTEIVAFTDDDCVPDRGWVDAILAGFAHGEAQVIAGRTTVGGVAGLHRVYLEARNPLQPLPMALLAKRGPLRRLRDYLFPAREGLSDGSPLYSAPTANLAVRRRLFEQVGPFDPAFVGAEDEDFCRRVHDHVHTGAPIQYRTDALVDHVFDRSLRSTLRRAHRYGASTIPMSRKHDEVRPIVYPVPVLVAIVGVAAARSRRRGLATIGLAVSPSLAYPRWLSRAVSERRPAIAGLGYLQLVEEVLAMAGEVRGLVEARR